MFGLAADGKTDAKGRPNPFRLAVIRRNGPSPTQTTRWSKCFAATSARSKGERPVALVFVGGTLYLVGTIGVTIVCNVPLNNMLARLHPQDTEAEGRWEEYVTKWTAWNHVRTLAGVFYAFAVSVNPAWRRNRTPATWPPCRP
jgi:hypothetical protein